MSIVILLYVQQALGMLQQELKSDSPNMDSATKTVRDTFATKIIDQLCRTGTYDHIIRREATMVDMGLDSVKVVAKHADSSPLIRDGVFDKYFEIRLKDRKVKSMKFLDLVPEISEKKETPSFKRKSTSLSGSWDSKHMRYDNERNDKKYGKKRTVYSTTMRYGNNYRSSFLGAEIKQPAKEKVLLGKFFSCMMFAYASPHPPPPHHNLSGSQILGAYAEETVSAHYHNSTVAETALVSRVITTLHCNPFRLPAVTDLLSHPRTIIYHPNPKVFSLNAWLLSTSSSQRKAFHRKSASCSQLPGGQGPRRIIQVNSDSLVVGVVKNKSIYIQQL